MGIFFEILKPTLEGLERSARVAGNDLVAEAFEKLLQPAEPIDSKVLGAFGTVSAAEVMQERIH